MQNAKRREQFCILHFAFCIRAAATEVPLMLVIKFGGTSVGDADRVANAIDIVAETLRRYGVSPQEIAAITRGLRRL